MSRVGIRPSYRALFIFSVLSFVGIFAFQNCGKAGFEESDGGLNDISSLSGDARLSDTVFPVETTLNQISYMSCPASGAPTVKNSLDPLSPFYGIRAGAYDNIRYASFFGSAGYSVSEQLSRLKGGVGITNQFYADVQRKYARSDEGILAKSITNHPKAQGMRPVLALVYGNQSRMSRFGFDYTLIQPLLDSVSGSFLPSYLSKAARNGALGGVKQSFFSALDPAHRGLVGSLAWGKSEPDRDYLANELQGNLFLTAGYSASGGSNITELATDGTDNRNTLIGRGYRIGLKTTSAEGLQAAKSHIAWTVSTYDMSVDLANPGGKTYQYPEGWDCFSLRVVRHIDRMDLNNVRPMQECRDPFTGASKSPPQYTGICDTKTASGTLIQGVRVICPTQGMNSSIYANSTNLTRLELARRFLPADMWELNTDPNYMYAVPTAKANAMGNCYASGDNDPTKYIQYNLSGCGPSGNECPAFISICYRKN